MPAPYRIIHLSWPCLGVSAPSDGRPGRVVGMCCGKTRTTTKYRVWMRFADGTEGTADFGDFAGRGVFRQWEDPGVWEGMSRSADV